MKPFNTVRHEISAEDGSVVLRFVDAKPLYRRRIRGVPWEPVAPTPPPEHDVAVLAVRFDREDAAAPPTRITGISLWLEGGVNANEINRFGWKRWLAVADAIARTGGDIGHPSWRSDDPADPSTISGKITRAAYADLGVPIPTRRPGRKGHPLEFYEEVARRYVQLRAEGATNPTQRIAKERHFSRDTVAGWVRRARQLGYLPKAREGRAG
jgi:hypothetical protein